MRLVKIGGVLLLSTLLLSSIACATPTYHLSTSVNGQGSVMPVSGDYLEGKSCILLAKPASGWEFDHWEGAASGDNGLVTITMNSDKSVTAFFVETGMSSMSEKGFSITLPEGWEETPAGLVEEGTAYYSISACSGSGAMVIVAEMDASGLSLQTFYEASKIGLEAFGDYDILSEEEITIDGMPAKQMIYTVVIGGATSQMLQCVLVKGDTGWLITFSCEPECWDTMESTFNAMLNSFELLD
ncbi:MAG: PsbP-related protein [Dehalococcoidia bacterium]